MDKKLTSLLDLKKSDFDNYVSSGAIKLRPAKLIPTSKFGDESSLTSIFLASLRLIKEFRHSIMGDVKMPRSGELFVYTEVVFPDHPESRVDGLMLVVQSGVIKDAAILEMKNGSNSLENDQVQRYMEVAKYFSIPRLITISNEFVSDPTQHPLGIKSSKGLSLYHFSWSYLLTISHLLLQNNDSNIADNDQVEIMKEVIAYFESDKSGVCDFTQMRAGWTKTVDNINARTLIRTTDQDVVDTVISWQQEERNIALLLSRYLGVLVKSGESKYKGDYKRRIDDDLKSLVSEKKLHSFLNVADAVSDIEITADFQRRSIEMKVSLNVPTDKTLKGQLGWIKKQLETCASKNSDLFQKYREEIIIEVYVRNARSATRLPLDKFDILHEELKGKEIKSCSINQLKDFGKTFSSRVKFVEMIEEMSRDYYKMIVQNLRKWVPTAPKMTNTDNTQGNIEEQAQSPVEVVVTQVEMENPINTEVLEQEAVIEQHEVEIKKVA
jgi:hypothetical protein